MIRDNMANKLTSINDQIKPRMMLSYLHQMSGQVGKSILKASSAGSDHDVSHIILDHCYSKPWNAHSFPSRIKPARTLFFSYPSRSHVTYETLSGSDGVIDFENSKPTTEPPYDMIKARALMTEWERHIDLAHVDEGSDEWEENINRTGWTLAQNRLFNRVTKVLHSHQLAKLAYLSSSNEPVMRRIYVDKSAERLRQILASVYWDVKKTQWLHITLMESLSDNYLTIYMDIIQTLRAKVPVLVDKMTAVTLTAPGRNILTSPDTMAVVNKRPWDPILPSLLHNKLKKLPGSPLLLIVPFAPSPSSTLQGKRTRFWHSQLSNLGKVVLVTMHTAGGSRSTVVSQCLEHMIGATRTKVIELKEHFPNRPIVMIGWSVGGLIACHVALVEHVAAVVALAFPFTGLKGGRGDVDDPLLESRVPTLFVIGEFSPLAIVDDVEDLREKMKAETSLVVVGGADDWLRVNHAKKKEEGVTQTIVDRCLLNEIGDFLGAILTNMSLQMMEIPQMNQKHFSVPSVVYHEGENTVKRRKRKLDSIKYEDILSGPRHKHQVADTCAASSTMSNSVLTQSPVKDGGHQTLNQLLDLGVATSTGFKRNYTVNKPVSMKKFKISQGFVESASSDSSSSSLLGSVGQGGDELESKQKTQYPPLSFAFGKNATVPPGSLTLNIGSLSSLGQIVKRTTPSLQKSGISIHSLVGKSGLSRSRVHENFEVNITGQPTMMASGALLHQGKNVIATVPKSSLPVALQTVPVRSAFSNPRTCQQSTIGLSSLITYSLASGSNVSALNSAGCPSSLLITSGSGTSANISDIENPKPYEVAMTNASSNGNQMTHTLNLEPNQEQVQAIQKLQFHDFPLTTTCLTRTTSSGGPVITQAKILSGSGLDFRKLKTINAGKAASLLLTTSGKQTFVTSQDLTTSSKMFPSGTEQDCSFLEPVSSTSLIHGDLTKKSNSGMNFTVSSVKLHLPEHQSQLRDTPVKVLTPSKTPQLSVLMLSPEKLNQIDKFVNKPVTQDTCSGDLLVSLPAAMVDANPLCSSTETKSSFVFDAKDVDCEISPPQNFTGDLGPHHETFATTTAKIENIDKLEASLTSDMSPILPPNDSSNSRPSFDTPYKHFAAPGCRLSTSSSSPTLALDPQGRSNDQTPGVSQEQPSVTLKSPSRSSRSKPPPFPTIAATRTRRIRAPKYMYYDL